MSDKPKHTGPQLHKYPSGSVLERVQQVDLAWFYANPEATERVRELIPGEFETDNRAPNNCGGAPTAPPPGQKWLVHVRAYRDPTDGTVITRIRETFLAPANVTPMERVK